MSRLSFLGNSQMLRLDHRVFDDMHALPTQRLDHRP